MLANIRTVNRNNRIILSKTIPAATNVNLFRKFYVPKYTNKEKGYGALKVGRGVCEQTKPKLSRET